MPPKKKGKGSGKKGKKGKAKEKQEKNTIAEETYEMPRELEEFFQLQVTDLANKVVTARDSLYVKEMALGRTVHNFESQTDIQSGTDAYLRVTRDEAERVANLLVNELADNEMSWTDDRHKIKEELQQMKIENAKTIAALKSETQLLGGEVAALDELAYVRDTVMARLDTLDIDMKQLQIQHKSELYIREKEQRIKMDRMTKVVNEQVAGIAAEFRKKTNEQLVDATKKNLIENRTVSRDLKTLSDKTIALITENDVLRSQEKTNCRRLDLLQGNDRALQKHTDQLEMQLTELTMRAEENEEYIRELRDQDEERRMEEGNGNQNIEGELVDAQAAVRKEQETQRQLEKRLAEAELALAGREKQNMQVDSALTNLRDSILLLTQELVPGLTEDALLRKHYEQRDYLLESLLVVLNSSAALNLDDGLITVMQRGDVKSRLSGICSQLTERESLSRAEMSRNESARLDQIQQRTARDEGRSGSAETIDWRLRASAKTVAFPDDIATTRAVSPRRGYNVEGDNLARLKLCAGLSHTTRLKKIGHVAKSSVTFDRKQLGTPWDL